MERLHIPLTCVGLHQVGTKIEVTFQDAENSVRVLVPEWTQVKFKGPYVMSLRVAPDKTDLEQNADH